MKSGQRCRCGGGHGLVLLPDADERRYFDVPRQRCAGGRDQIQHVEMARDIAARFNHLYQDLFTLRKAKIDEEVETLVGLDGRKMSKSYGNTIPLFEDEKKRKSRQQNRDQSESAGRAQRRRRKPACLKSTKPLPRLPTPPLPQRGRRPGRAKPKKCWPPSSTRSWPTSANATTS